jgi:hypothetical protein
LIVVETADGRQLADEELDPVAKQAGRLAADLLST